MSENEGGEFGESRYERSNLENPEQSYRRGFQQGARVVVEFLKDKLDPATLETLKHYVGIITGRVALFSQTQPQAACDGGSAPQGGALN